MTKYKSLLDIPIGTRMICNVDSNSIKAGDTVIRVERHHDSNSCCYFGSDNNAWSYLYLSELSDLPDESGNLHFTRIYDLDLLVKDDVVNILNDFGELETCVFSHHDHIYSIFLTSNTDKEIVILKSLFKAHKCWAKQIYLVTLNKPTRKGL